LSSSNALRDGKTMRSGTFEQRHGIYEADITAHANHRHQEQESCCPFPVTKPSRHGTRAGKRAASVQRGLCLPRQIEMEHVERVSGFGERNEAARARLRA